MTADAEAAMRKVIAAIDALPEWEKAFVGNKIFGDEAFRAMGRLLTDLATFEETMARMREAGAGSGAMHEEFAGATDTARAELGAFLADFRGIIAEVGTVLLPTMRDGLAEATSDGQALPGAIGAALGQTRAAVAVRGTMVSIRSAASLDLTAQGMNIMNTLAAGMRARAAAVVEEIRKVTQAVRDHLPSSPAKVGPLSDIHRLKFAETIAGSIRPEPVVKAMRALSAAGMDAAKPFERRIGVLSGAQRRALAAPRTRPGVFAAAAREAETSRAGSSGLTTIDASLHVGAVHFGSKEDKAEFETLLRRHSKTVAEVVQGETRRRGRLAF